MILRKPYAIFIKLFRPIHFMFVICLGLLINSQNKILTFLNNYLYTNELLNTKNMKESLISYSFYLIPILLILLSLFMFSIMFRKNKPYKLYFISIFSFLVILVINIYTSNFLAVFENTTIAIKSVKLIHDFILMTVILESILIIMFIARGLGINFKKFDFSSDIAKFNISEKDKEEFELDLKFDFNETKRKRKEKLRNYKYFYLENKFLINIGLITFTIIVIIITSLIVLKRKDYNKEGIEYNLNGFNIVVNSTNILNTNYEGNKITDNYLVIVKANLNTYMSTKTLYLKDFTLKIGEATIYPTTNYNQYLTDIGNVYNNDNLTTEHKSYIFVYEVPLKFITSDMYFNYNNLGYKFAIKLNPKNLVYGHDTINFKLKDEMDFKRSLGDISFKIENYEISDYYKIYYDYCLKQDNCIESVEYLRPSIDENFDKTILKLDIDYLNNTKLDLLSFYNLLSEFGDIYYYKNGEWKVQDDKFEKIISNKGSNYYSYIGVDSDIKNSEKLKLVFNIRGIKYEYELK